MRVAVFGVLAFAALALASCDTPDKQRGSSYPDPTATARVAQPGQLFYLSGVGGVAR